MSLTYTVDGNTTEFDKATNELRSYFKSIPSLRKVFFNMFKNFDKLIEFKSGPTVGTRMTVFFKPSKLFLNFLSACRAGNLDNLFIK